MTRSKGSSHLVHYHEDIGRLERENKKKKQLAVQREAEMAACDAAGNVVNEDELQFEEKHHGVFQDTPPPVANDHHAAGENAASAAAANDARLAALNARPAPVRQTLRDHNAPMLIFPRQEPTASYQQK